MHGYSEVFCGTIVARQVFDKLPALPPAITSGTEPFDHPVENSAKRKPPACSE
jgi:hypothetical protein